MNKLWILRSFVQVEQVQNLPIMQIAQTVLQAEFDRQGAQMFVQIGIWRFVGFSS